jgi:hypothetical protein
MFNMQEVMNRLAEKDPERQGRQGDGEVASMLEWQISGSQLRKFIRGFRDLPITTIFTALVKEDKDKLSGKVTKRPSLPGKMAAQVAGMFDIVTYMYMDENPESKQQDRLLLTEATDKITAKDRSNRLPRPYMENPTMADIYKYTIKENQ